MLELAVLEQVFVTIVTLLGYHLYLHQEQVVLVEQMLQQATQEQRQQADLREVLQTVELHRVETNI